MSIKLPPFGKYLDKLHEAGIETGSARGFWGGVNQNGGLVVTSWIDANDGNGRFYLWRPPTNHGGLKAAWELGNIRPGVEVSVILLRQRGNVALCNGPRSVAEAALLPDKWLVMQMVTDQKWQALMEPKPFLEITVYSPSSDGNKIHDVTIQVVHGYRKQKFELNFTSPLDRSEVSKAALAEFRKIAERLSDMTQNIDNYIVDTSPGHVQVDGMRDVLKFGTLARNIVRDEFQIFAVAAKWIAKNQLELDFHYPKRGAAA